MQRGREIEQHTPGDAVEARFDLELKPSGDRDATGPYAHGGPGSRFMYLCWASGPDRVMFRRAKLMLADIPADVWTEALGGDTRLEAELRLTDARGGPRCARVPADSIYWRAVV